MNIKKMATTVAFAALAMMLWVTFKVYFIHDPDNFFEVDARPYVVAWTMDNCRAFQCGTSQNGTAVKDAVETEEGWLYVLVTSKEPGELYLLVPRDDPSHKHLVGVEQASDGDLRIVDNGPQPGEVTKAGSATKEKKTPLYKQFKYGLGILAVVVLAIFWIRRRASGDKRSLDDMLHEHAQPPPMDAAGIMAQAARKQGRAAPAAPAIDPNDPVGSLLKAGKGEEAVRKFEGCIAADAAFRLPHAEHVLPLAKAALAAGNLQVAVGAVRGFDRKYPGHELIPDVYMFSAKLMAERLGNGDMARKLLQVVMERYPGHHLAQEAKRTLQAMA